MTYDAIVIGAGMSGMYQLHTLRRLGLSCLVIEAGSDVGGTWYWNRYPGCRFDSETVSYCFSFSQEVLDEWDWSEKFAPQAETRRYLDFVADKFDLRRDIRFNARVVSAHYGETGNAWAVTTSDGRTEHCRYLITAVGILSAPSIPHIPGRETFEGRSFHTADWPRDGLDLAGKRVAVFGTGATGVQVVQELAKIAGQLTVFQKEASWAKAIGNSKISPEEMARLKGEYPTVFARCKATTAGFLHDWDARSIFDLSDEERERVLEARYHEPGFGLWLGNFHDIATNVDAANLVSDFVARKIRARVTDPVVAERLIPKDHPFGARRVPLETGYYEAYNQPNVRLVDLSETPVERITARGVVVAEEELSFDVIVFATGFHAVRGAFDRIDFRGAGGEALKDRWADGPVTYMGIGVCGFPNMFMLVGPHNGSTFCNVPRCIEQNVDFVTAQLEYMRARRVDRCEVTPDAETSWTNWIHDMGKDLIVTKFDAWWNHESADGSGRRKMLLYTGGQQAWLAYCDDVVAEGYKGFRMEQSPTAPAPIAVGAPAV